MQWLLIILLLAVQLDPAEGVRLAETGFAKAFADRDKDKFFSYVADDATFLSGLGTLRGKARVIQGWSRLLEGPEAPFSWGPERVHVSADGKLGFSHGPLYDKQGKLAGHYTSMWRREADGSWKVLFDGPGAAAVYQPEEDPKVDEGFVTTGDGVKLQYRKSGASPLTVIIPGDFLLWDDFNQLTEIATVIAYEPRNRAVSSCSADPATIQQDVKDLETIRNHFKVEKFVPIGFSYLGKMVVLYAREHPERVTRIVQIGPAEMTSGSQPVKTIDSMGDVANVTVPVLTIHGTEDRNAPYEGGKEWAMSLPDARLLTVKGAAHSAWIDDPIMVFTSIREFLRGNWPYGAESLRKGSQ